MELELLKIKGTMTSLEIAEITGKRHDNILADIRDEIDKLGIERGVLIFQETYYTNKQNGQNYPMFEMEIDGILQLGARYSAEIRYKIIQALKNKNNLLRNTAEKIDDIRIKESELYFKYANAFTNEKYRETMLVLGANKLNGSDILPLPKLERKSYTATEIGEMLGISKLKVGKITNEHNLKTSEFGYWAFDKAKYGNKQVESFRYYETVKNEIKKYI